MEIIDDVEDIKSNIKKKVVAVRLNGNTVHLNNNTVKLSKLNDVTFTTNSNFNFSTDSSKTLTIRKNTNAGNTSRNFASNFTFVPTRIRTNVHEQNIDNFNDRIIIIDGKEATEKALKKLPASDIETINVKNGSEMIEKYGDKAKKGVVFIGTKKAKN